MGDTPNGTKSTGIKIKNFLKVEKARKWCIYEWFYSDIDKTIFLQDNEFVTCLRATFPDLQPGTKLTQLQWSVVRRSLGKPRRCSSKFFQEERATLEQKRNKIRLLQLQEASQHNLEHFEDIPDKIPGLLALGTSVTAHISDGLFVGEIEAVDPLTHSYRIRFDRPGLGTHTVPDYNVQSNTVLDMITKQTKDSRPGSSSPYPCQGQLGGYPVVFLRCIVKMTQLLHIKRDLLSKIRNLNSAVERKTSFKEGLDSGIQLMYAKTVLEFDKLNKYLIPTVKELQEHCKTHLGSETIAAVEIKSNSEGLANTLVRDANKLLKLEHEKSIKLVTELTALLVQVQKVSANATPGGLSVLTESLRNLKTSIHPSNLHSFQDNVEVPLAHIQQQLKQELMSPEPTSQPR